MNTKQTDQSGKFYLSYEFNAPKELVFTAFSNAEALGEWWGPVEMNNTVMSLDFRVGGIFHFRMEGHGQVSYGRMLFTQVEPCDLLQFSNAFCDEHAQVKKAPFEVNLPLEILYTLSFTEVNGKTTIDMTGQALNASEEAMEGFISINDDMKRGFESSFEQLSGFLGK